jgi:hypothetical protein
MGAWDSKHIGTLRNDIGRTGFKGVIIVIDSDDNSESPFENYRRNAGLTYSDDKPICVEDSSGAFWLLDRIKDRSLLPVIGINVPRTDSGCLETDLLSAYGFPTTQQPEYGSFTNIIKRATTEWKIPYNDDGKPWWEINEKAKMDKFIYSALREGFKVSDKKPALPNEPKVINDIRVAMDLLQ